MKKFLKIFFFIFVLFLLYSLVTKNIEDQKDREWQEKWNSMTCEEKWQENESYAEHDPHCQTVVPIPPKIETYGAPKGSGVLKNGTFHGHNCLGDCSGHEAGYEWAEDKGISSVDDCGGNSSSFIEGCQIYVEENY